MTIQIGSSGTAATPAQLADLRASLAFIRDLPGQAKPLARHSYSDAHVSYALPTDGTAATSATVFTSVPADAVAIEICNNSGVADDYIFFALKVGRVSATGTDLATRGAANLLSCRYAAGTSKIVIPLAAVGAVPATWRFAGSKTTSVMQSRFLNAAAYYPFLNYATTEEIVLTGANGVMQLPYTDPNRFPALYKAAEFQVLGAGNPMMTFATGVSPSATVGIPLVSGETYRVDFARDNIAVSALKFWLPTGCNITGNTMLTA